MTTADRPGMETTAPEVETPLPSFPKRFMQVFFSPGDLTAALAKNPAWAAAFIVGAVLVIGQTAMIPTEVWEVTFREAMIRQGREMPPGFGGGGFMRVAGAVGAGLGFTVMTFLFSGIVTLIFAFVMGDEGRYTQYLAVLTHAWLIPMTIGFLLLPLKIIQQNPQFTINLGTFFFFLPTGYLLKVLTVMDLSMAWAWLVVAQGAHAIDPRRSFTSAAVGVMVLFLATSLILAVWAPMP